MGRKIGHFGPQVGHLGRKNVEASKTKKHTKTYGFSSICGLLRLRTWPKMAKKTALTSFWRPCGFGHRFEALLGPSWAHLGPQLGPILGAKLASKTSQNCIENHDEVEGATWRQLERTSAVKEAFWAVNPGVAGGARRIARTPPEDEVFEEEESEEVVGDSARPCHPVCDRGRRIASRIPPGQDHARGGAQSTQQTH